MDPSDGRIPPMTDEPESGCSPSAKSTYYYDFPDAVVSHPFETYEDLGPYDRCITRGVLSSMMPTAYNMGTQIFQFPGHVVIQNEMIHEVRVIPTDGRPHVSDRDPPVHGRLARALGRRHPRGGDDELQRQGGADPQRQYAADQSRPAARGAPTRTGPNTLIYEATVHDPKTWTRPWTVSLPLTQHPEYQMFEYACHEGNYAVRNILSAERAAEKAKAATPPLA